MKYLAVLGVLLCAACVHRPMEFPVGFFGAETPTDAKVLAALGFDAIQSYETKPPRVEAMAAAARKEGQLLLIAPNEVQDSTYSGREFPGVYWYLQDEPDVNHVSLSELAGYQKKTLEWAPGAKTAFVVGDGHKAKDYPGVADAIMVDWYPVPHLPLESAGDNVRMTKEAAGGRKVWAVLQAMDWRDYPQGNPNKPRIGRFPTMDEIRFMSYDAVVNGADGIWYFIYTQPDGSNLSKDTEKMFSVAWKAQEIRAMAPIFARGRGIPLPFPVETGGVAGRAWTYHGRDYVVLEARTGGVDVRVPDVMLEPTWKPMVFARLDPREALVKKDDGYYLRSHTGLVLKSRLRLKRFFGL